jgi:ribonuclease HII
MVCGVDEVGRGPLAGPVVAAAVILPRRLPRELRALDDSKVLPAAVRERLTEILRRCAVIGLGAASVAEIDRLNILNATMLAMTRAVAALGVRPDVALIDGNRAPAALTCVVHTIIQGDGESFSIAAASVIAKTARDRAMTRLAQRYGNYGWDRNAGYATAEHRQSIRSFGVTVHHRHSFAPVREALGISMMEPELPLPRPLYAA